MYRRLACIRGQAKTEVGREPHLVASVVLANNRNWYLASDLVALDAACFHIRAVDPSTCFHLDWSVKGALKPIRMQTSPWDGACFPLVQHINSKDTVSSSIGPSSIGTSSLESSLFLNLINYWNSAISSKPEARAATLASWGSVMARCRPYTSHPSQSPLSPREHDNIKASYDYWASYSSVLADWGRLVRGNVKQNADRSPAT